MDQDETEWSDVFRLEAVHPLGAVSKCLTLTLVFGFKYNNIPKVVVIRDEEGNIGRYTLGSGYHDTPIVDS